MSMQKPQEKEQGEKQEMLFCQTCLQEKKSDELIPAEMVRQNIISIIKKKGLKWSNKEYICRKDLNFFREAYIKDALETENGELSALDAEVLKSLKEHELLSENINAAFEQKQSLRERISDKIAEFGGSWKFIIFFFIVLIMWMGINTSILVNKPFDPFPFILLNLLLSTIAALQAPVIMMSQNRLEAKDRLRAEHDYRINLKAELEIRHLHEKIDHLLRYQWQRLLEIQEIQTEIMEEIMRKGQRKK